jgi:hypothetical protein
MSLRSRPFILLALSLFCLASPVFADDTEQRDFSIFVDGKESGSSRMTIVQKEDGTTYMSAALDVKFRQLIAEYNFKLETQEWWKNGRLVGMKTVGNENGKRTEITVAADNNQLRMRLNGRDSFINPETWTSSYWKLADARYHNKQVPVLEVDTGKEHSSELKFIGTEKLKIGDFQDCYHFRVMANPAPVDLWYDRFHRVVRIEFTESGHRTIVQLTKITR